MSDRVLVRETDGSRGRYVLRAHGAEAELTYKVRSPTLLVADHVGVPDVLRGTGAGLALVERMVADARSEGVGIVPQCPFVEAQRRRHPDWADVFAPQDGA